MNKKSVYMEGKRGWTLFPFGKEGVASEEVIDVHLVSIEPGSVRGNHYHLNKEEHLVVFGGKSIVATCSSEHPDDRQEMEIDGKTPYQVKIDNGVVHAVKNKGDLPVYLFCYSRLLKKNKRPKTVSQVIL